MNSSLIKWGLDFNLSINRFFQNKFKLNIYFILYTTRWIRQQDRFSTNRNDNQPLMFLLLVLFNRVTVDVI